MSDDVSAMSQEDVTEALQTAKINYEAAVASEELARIAYNASMQTTREARAALDMSTNQLVSLALAGVAPE